MKSYLDRLLVCSISLSAVASVLKFRCGYFPSLRDVHFCQYRNAVDLTYMNSANARTLLCHLIF